MGKDFERRIIAHVPEVSYILYYVIDDFRFDTIGWFAKDIEIFEKVSQVIFSSKASQIPVGLTPPNLDNPTILRLPDYERFIIEPEAREEYDRMLKIVEKTFEQVKFGRYLAYSPEEICEIGSGLLSYEAWQVHKDWMISKQPILHPEVRQYLEATSKITVESYEANDKRQVTFCI